jgi:hypothetical protein
MTTLRVDNIRNPTANQGVINQTNGRMDPYRFAFPSVSELPTGAASGETYLLTTNGKLYTSRGNEEWSVKSGFSLPSGEFSFGWTSSNIAGTTTPNPINIYFRRIIYQTKYTTTQLLDGGAEDGAIFRNLKFYVGNPVPSDRSMNDMNVRMFHTDQGTNVTYGPISGESKTTVYFLAGDFTPAESTGEKTLTFGTGNTADGFEWNGVNDVVIEWCSSQNDTNWTNAGGLRFVSESGTSRYNWTDASGNSCNDNPGSNASVKPSIKMEFF